MPATLITMFPVVAPVGTDTTIWFWLHEVGVAATPLNVIVLGISSHACGIPKICSADCYSRSCCTMARIDARNRRALDYTTAILIYKNVVRIDQIYTRILLETRCDYLMCQLVDYHQPLSEHRPACVMPRAKKSKFWPELVLELKKNPLSLNVVAIPAGKPGTAVRSEFKLPVMAAVLTFCAFATQMLACP